MLELLSADKASTCLTLIEPARAAELIAMMDPLIVVALLSAMAPQMAAERLIDPDIAAVFTALAKPQAAARILMKMKARQAGSALASLAPESAALCVAELPEGMLGTLFLSMPDGSLGRVEPLLPGMTAGELATRTPREAAMMLADMRLPCAVARAIRIDLPHLRNIFAEMSMESARSILSSLTPGAAAEMLQGDSSAARILSSLDTDAKSAILSNTIPEVGRLWVEGMLTSDFDATIKVLAGLNVEQVTSICEEIANSELLGRLVVAFEPDSSLARGIEAVIERKREG
jgi:Mg/Co/Ni transporter MgtE